METVCKANNINATLFQSPGSRRGNSPLLDVPNPAQIWPFEASGPIFIICIRGKTFDVGS